MKKTKESIQAKLSMVDVVFELLDARAPKSSKNPVIDDILGEKAKITILNKSDLADEEISELWMEYYTDKNSYSIKVDSTNKKDLNDLIKLTDKIVREKNQALKKRGVINRPTRAMIVGIPNVGKSTLINTLSGRKGARVGNRPGITKTNQWIKTGANLELLDTPGILWPKFEDRQVGMNLAFIGSIKDEIMDTETLALRLIEKLCHIYPKLMEERYNFSLDGKEGLELMEEIASKRGCIIRGGEVDYTRVSNIVLDEFRKGIIGKITLEKPEQDEG